MMTEREPGYWMYETSGVLRPAVEAYLAGGELSAEQIAALRAYLRQWIMSSVWDRNPYIDADGKWMLSELRKGIEGLTTRKAIAVWLNAGRDEGLDPL